MLQLAADSDSSLGAEAGQSLRQGRCRAAALDGWGDPGEGVWCQYEASMSSCDPTAGRRAANSTDCSSPDHCSTSTAPSQTGKLAGQKPALGGHRGQQEG
jgi:hypothetical protein